MGISPTNSNFFFNFSSLFTQGGNKSFSSIQAAAANYSNGAFQVRSANITVADVLDLSPEGLNAANKAAAESSKTTDTETTESEGIDTTLTSSELTESERVETIRVNKNAVLARVNELLTEQGIDVSADQAFELTTNLMDGSISVKGIDDAELASAFNDALQGDEELVRLMQKTRDELGLPEQENTVPRNFTIQFNSMQETPEGTEIDFHIDLYVTQPSNLLEEGATTETGEGEGEPIEWSTPTFQMSITLTNRLKADASSTLIEQLNDSAKSKRTQDDEAVEEEEDIEETEENGSITVGSTEESENAQAEILPLDAMFSSFGSFFQANSTVLPGQNGLDLNWNLQFLNWDASGISGEPSSQQQIFQTMNLGGTMQFPVDATGELTAEQQASQLQQQFSQGVNSLFSQGSATPWSARFFEQSGLAGLGFFQ